MSRGPSVKSYLSSPKKVSFCPNTEVHPIRAGVENSIEMCTSLLLSGHSLSYHEHHARVLNQRGVVAANPGLDNREPLIERDFI